ncbi:MAG: hypothetical protein ACXVAJ_02375 [Parachlamydiaceae bacterium]
MLHPVHNPIFFDDFHRYILEHTNLTPLPSKIFPKHLFHIRLLSKFYLMIKMAHFSNQSEPQNKSIEASDKSQGSKEEKDKGDFTSHRFS